MNKYLLNNVMKNILFLSCLLLPTWIYADQIPDSNTEKLYPINVTHNLLVKAKQNTNWKIAFVTGKNEQVVFMNISPLTNPKNEIGMETHPFDQLILIVQGKGKAVLDKKIFRVNSGDMIFIPQGTQHNVINLNANQPLKIISVYSDTDIPAKVVYKTKSDEAKE